MDETTTIKDPLLDPTDSINLVGKAVDKFFDAANVKAVYGQEIRNGDTVIIPTAEVMGVLGVGAGTGGGRDEKQNRGGGGGAGGGGRILSRPVAALIIAPDGVRVEPIVDITKIWLGALTAAGFMFAMLARMRRRRVPRG